MRRAFDLSKHEPIAEGTANWVFEHPDDPSLLIKVVRPDVIPHRWGTKSRWYKRLNRARQNAGFIRELQEYCVLRAHHPHDELPVERPVALVDTNFGLGLVVEAVRDSDGNLARTILNVVKEAGFTPSVREKLDEFRDELLRFDTVIGEMNAGNLVIDEKRDRIVLIDGIGENAAIPVNYYSRRLRHRTINRRFDRMIESLQRAS